jgi:hypothetical protein
MTITYPFCTVVGHDLRIPRQADSITTSATDGDVTTPPEAYIGTTDINEKSSGKSNHVITILLGTLVTLFVLVICLISIATIATLWGCKMNHRRRMERELVLRTKHDIFEGVPNAVLVATESSCKDPTYNVSDSNSTETLKVTETPGPVELLELAVSPSLVGGALVHVESGVAVDNTTTTQERAEK